jgi:hypothetical protein
MRAAGLEQWSWTRELFTIMELRGIPCPFPTSRANSENGLYRELVTQAPRLLLTPVSSLQNGTMPAL